MAKKKYFYIWDLEWYHTSRTSSFIQQLYTSDEVELIRSKIEEIYQYQVNECGGEENLQKIGDQHNAKALIAYDRYFEKYLKDPLVQKIVEYFLGDYFIVHQKIQLKTPLLRLLKLHNN